MYDKPHLLVVEDEEAFREAVAYLLETNGYLTDTAVNGQEAIQKLQQNSYSLVITDLNMPEVRGEELIQYILTLETPPIILVQTVVTDMNVVIELMRKGVYDYIPKPFSNSEFLHRVKLASEVSFLRRLSSQIERKRMERIQAQLDWNLWKEKMLKQESDVEDLGLIESIRTSLSQASGIGSLVSLAQLLRSKAKLENETYLVPKKLMDMLFENAEVARSILQNLEELDSLMQTDIEYEVLSVEEISRVIENCIQTLNQYAKIGNHEVKLSKVQSLDSSKLLSVHKEYFSRVINELLINAFKFSKLDTIIYILLEIHKDNLKLSFLSDPKEDQRGNYGIPESMQNLIFEPFFRISKYVHEEYPSHDFGIGLTFVDKVVRKHRGKVSAYMVKSHLGADPGSNPNQMVTIEIEIPFKIE